MLNGRIFFKGNPWPEGHPIKKFELIAKEINGDVWFGIELQSENYYSERNIEDDENAESASDWEAPIVWGNFHRCSLSTDESQGFKVCAVSDYNKEFLDGFEVEVDTHIDFDEHEWDDFTFRIYLLGHDAVTKHKFRFERIDGGDLFRVIWAGKIALAYVGDYEFKYDFCADISNVPFPTLNPTS